MRNLTFKENHLISGSGISTTNSTDFTLDVLQESLKNTVKTVVTSGIGAGVGAIVGSMNWVSVAYAHTFNTVRQTGFLPPVNRQGVVGGYGLFITPYIAVGAIIGSAF